MIRALVAVLFVVTNAYPISVDWHGDSGGAFSVSISGTGLNWTGSVTSSSGLWQLDTTNRCAYKPDVSSSAPFEMSLSGKLTFLGERPANLISNDMVTPNYNEFIPLGNPTATSSIWDGIMFGIHSGEYWTGFDHLVVTSIPDLNDPSTWTWVADYNATGPRLTVPESGGAVCLGFATLLLFAMRRRMIGESGEHQSD
jgi:hypothetical protein